MIVNALQKKQQTLYYQNERTYLSKARIITQNKPISNINTVSKK